jgi:hypothetical protein
MQCLVFGESVSRLELQLAEFESNRTSFRLESTRRVWSRGEEHMGAPSVLGLDQK